MKMKRSRNDSETDLNTFAVGCSAGVNIFTSDVATNKRNGFDLQKASRSSRYQ
jgi:hypothetical protein